MQRIHASVRCVLGVAAFAMGVGALSPTLLQAASIVCPNNIGYNAPISDNLTPSTGCELSTLQNDFMNPLQVNVDALFGFTDWIFTEKAIEVEQDIDVGLAVTGGVLSGTWSIDDIWTTLGATDVMLVLKGPGSKKSEPSEYVGYLIEFGALSGEYLTPFQNSKGKSQGISHFSAYYRVGTHTVPEPQLLVLLSVGFFMAARRFRRVRVSS